jgi:serine/threonine-protein kinase
VARFAREARAAAKLQSEHVARVLDVGSLEGGIPYLVMEYLEGEDLARVVATRGALPCVHAVGYLLQASEALAEAHALGIVHRDLKPANLFLAKRASGRPVIKVLDFGLSKFSTGSGQEHVTSESSILGSPLYMSPEQLLSAGEVDARSDIWSLGVALYELVTAHSPFPSEKMPELVAAILSGHERPVETWRSDIPPGLRDVLRRCLEKDPARRFADVAELARALAPFGPKSSDASVERISHVLGAVRAVASPQDDAGPEGTVAATSANANPSPPKQVAVSSVSASSRSITRASPGAVRPVAPQATVGRRGAWILGSLGALFAAAFAGLMAMPKTVPKADANPVAPSTAPAAALGPSADGVPGAESPPAPPLGPATTTPISAPPSASVASPGPTAKTPMGRPTHVASSTALPRPAPSSRPLPPPSAQPQPQPSATDPLSRLKPL